jgi:hypothetical protein
MICDYCGLENVSARSHTNTQCISELKFRVAKLEQELAKWKLEWHTGKPPCDGWYWVRKHAAPDGWRTYWIYADNWNDNAMNEWTGPIPEPEGGKE